ncbi:MAG: T9SS type A sorting domain-containing protein [bacterium]|nr:MAG: T9SS type A sorting domain-containing protein [bacterium]
MSKRKITWLMGKMIIVCLSLTLMTPQLLSQSLMLSISDTSAASNSLLKLPIRTTNVTGLGILSMVITLTFDQTVLDALGANSEGTISQSWGNPLTTDEPGEIRLTMAGISPLEGEGLLTYVFFEVTGAKDDTTTILFEDVSINEGGIVADAVAGKFTALEGESAPDIRLAIPDSSGDAGSIIDLPITVSDLTGLNIDSLRLTLTFNKYVLEALDVITTGTLAENWTDSIEAAMPGVLSFVLKGTTPLSDSGVLCLLQFHLNGSPGMLTPIHFQGVRFYNNTDTLKIGTTDGNIAISGGMGSEVTMSIPDISADSSTYVVVPIFISDVTNKDVWSVSIELEFNENVLSYQSFNITNTLLEGWLHSVNETSGKIAISCAGTSNPLLGQGVLIDLEFQVIGEPGMQTALDFSKMELNEGNTSVTAYGGIFTVNYVIPVELVSFNALVEGKDILLTWRTASESENYGFEVGRAINPGEWHTIGFVQGHGTTTINHQYSYADKNLDVGTYYYRLKQIDIDGSFEYSKFIEIVINPPKKFSLGQNFPNPFNPTTLIPFGLPEKSKIKLTLYNLLGEIVEVISIEEYSAGHHEVSFDASTLSAGLYLYKLEAKDFVDVKKLLILK